MKINLGTIAIVNILAFLISASAEHLIPIWIPFSILFASVVLYFLKPIIEILRMDFKISPDSIELKELYEDLSSKAGR